MDADEGLSNVKVSTIQAKGKPHAGRTSSGGGSKQKRESSGGPPGGADRRPLRFWQPFNDWWRAELEKLGRRPNAQEILEWYNENAVSLWKDEAPTLHETRVHAKCLRSLPLVRDYFRSYRAKKRTSRDQHHTSESGAGDMGLADDDDLAEDHRDHMYADLMSPYDQFPTSPGAAMPQLAWPTGLGGAGPLGQGASLLLAHAMGPAAADLQRQELLHAMALQHGLSLQALQQNVQLVMLHQHLATHLQQQQQQQPQLQLRVSASGGMQELGPLPPPARAEAAVAVLALAAAASGRGEAGSARPSCSGEAGVPRGETLSASPSGQLSPPARHSTPGAFQHVPSTERAGLGGEAAATRLATPAGGASTSPVGLAGLARGSPLAAASGPFSVGVSPGHAAEALLHVASHAGITSCPPTTLELLQQLQQQQGVPSSSCEKRVEAWSSPQQLQQQQAGAGEGPLLREGDGIAAISLLGFSKEELALRVLELEARLAKENPKRKAQEQPCGMLALPKRQHSESGAVVTGAPLSISPMASGALSQPAPLAAATAPPLHSTGLDALAVVAALQLGTSSLPFATAFGSSPTTVCPVMPARCGASDEPI